MVLLSEMGERCTFKDDDDCSFSFSYKENPGKDVTISVQREKGTLCYITLRYVASRCMTLCFTFRYVTLHYNSSNFQSALFPVRDFSCYIKTHPQVSVLVKILLNPESALYFSSKLISFDHFCGYVAVTAADFSEYVFFSFISLSQGSRSTCCHSWRCRRSTGCGSSFAPYLETACYYPGMC